MFIECTLTLRPNQTTRVIHHFGKPVVFKPLSLTDTRLVAEVLDPGEAHRLATTPGYREFTDRVTGNSLAQPGTAPVPAPSANAPAATAQGASVSAAAPAPAPLTIEQMRALVAAEDSKSTAIAVDTNGKGVPDPPAFTPEEQALAETILSGQPAQIAKKLPDLSKPVLLAMISLEKSAPKPRPAVLKALEG
jgi:hypothetical protein